MNAETHMPARAADPRVKPLLAVQDLNIRFKLPQGWVTAVDGVGFDLRPGEILGIVGESGSGKSQILMSILGLTAENGAASGSIRYDGTELVGADARTMDGIRGSRIAMVFQDPMTSLNPYLRVERQLSEVLEAHQGLSGRAARQTILEMLARVGIPDPARRLSLYPHEFSGGMRQRVMIAMALLCKPSLLLADEPTTALDVTVQAQILDLMADLARDLGMAIILVTHDLGVVARLCDRVIVLYGGRIMEEGMAEPLFAHPKHPYTQGLLAATPRLDGAVTSAMKAIPGQPRALADVIGGCPFSPRCAKAVPQCHQEVPVLQINDAGRRLACHLERP
jgi:oligopeptide transport system ATP-binding protein